MKTFEVMFRAEVLRVCIVEADTKEEAWSKFHEGDYDPKTEKDTDCSDILYASMEEIK